MPRPKATVANLKQEIKNLADPRRAEHSQRYFKTGKGEYAEGDKFIGLTVPQLRSLAKKYRTLQLTEVEKLLTSKVHEERLLALLILRQKFRTLKTGQQKIIDFYFHHIRHVDNWDLVDTSAEMLGEHFSTLKSFQKIEQLLRARSLWERRIAIVSTYYDIKNNSFQRTLEYCQQLLNETDRLVQKAAGWMLREVGKRDQKSLLQFLDNYITLMPQTMYAAATERLSIGKKKHYRTLRQQHRQQRKQGFATKVFRDKNIDQGIRTAVKELKNNNVVAFPTETVYGLGARIFSPLAIANIFQVKSRPADNPLIAHVSNLNQVSQIAESLPADFHKLAKQFFPGPLTLVVSKKSTVPDIASAGLATIGVRMPNHPIALALIDLLGEPIVAPSANLSGKPSATTAQHVLQDFADKIPVILDGGQCEVGIESTILDLTSDQPTILRPGAITQQELAKVLGKKILYASHNTVAKPKSPGMKYRHYAPQAQIEVVEKLDKKTIEKIHKQAKKSIILYSQEIPTTVKKSIPHQKFNTTNLYAAFRNADDEGITKIFIILDDRVKAQEGLTDRIQRAAHK